MQALLHPSLTGPHMCLQMKDTAGGLPPSQGLMVPTVSLSTPPSRATYPLVDKLELEVTLTAVRVGVCAGLQGVPVILPAAQILAGQAGKRCPRP